MGAVKRLVPCLMLTLGLGACASLTHQDPLKIDVAGIEPLPGEGMELRLAVKIRVQNPNDEPVQYTGAALDLDVNGRSFASGVSDAGGTVPRYGEAVFTVPVTVSAFDMARQALGVMDMANQKGLPYRVSGKLEAGLFGTRRFSDEGTLDFSALGGK
jgi:LEA14-like dessication related protein